MGIAHVEAAAADEICAEELTAQFIAVIPGHDIEIAIGIEVAELEGRPQRRERIAGWIRAVPHELADESIALVEVVTYAADPAPAGRSHRRHRVERHIDDHGKIAVDFAVIAAAFSHLGKKGLG